jgi:hypothetical protein
VLSPELDLAGLDARHWKNWWQLLVPPRVLAQPAWALAILDGGKPIKVVVTGKGSIDPPPLPGLTEKDLSAWAKSSGPRGDRDRRSVMTSSRARHRVRAAHGSGPGRARPGRCARSSASPARALGERRCSALPAPH